tara:strand:+ start:269 stop:394 length:126 start_codon:yes stop_codon:yes gene_type:complete
MPKLRREKRKQSILPFVLWMKNYIREECKILRELKKKINKR